MRRHNDKLEGYFEFFLITSLLILCFLLIKNFIFSLLFASALVFFTYPYYKSLCEKTGGKVIPALFVEFLMLSLIVLPIYIISVNIFNQSGLILNNGIHLLSSIDLESCASSTCATIQNNLGFFDGSIESVLRKFNGFFTDSGFNLFSSITNFFISFLIFILAYFFLLKDGDKFVAYVKKLIPMKSTYKDALFIKFKDVTLAVFVNTILVAFIQGSLVGFGFWIIGIDGFLFWGLVASFAALVPYLGPSIIWGPVALYMLFTGNYFAGGFLALYGAFVVGLSDNFLRPFLLRKKTQVHPFLILLSILGGMQLFGFLLGIFLGPIIISLLVAILHLYELDFR